MTYRVFDTLVFGAGPITVGNSGSNTSFFAQRVEMSKEGVFAEIKNEHNQHELVKIDIHGEIRNENEQR